MTSSRYDSNNTAQLITPDGRTLVYLRRRLVPKPEVFATLRWRKVTATGVQQIVDGNDPTGEFGPKPPETGTRLDQIAAEEFQEPEKFWLLCDANGAVHPGDLEITGTRVRIPLPQGVPAASAAHD